MRFLPPPDFGGGDAIYVTWMDTINAGETWEATYRVNVRPATGVGTKIYNTIRVVPVFDVMAHTVKVALAPPN